MPFSSSPSLPSPLPPEVLVLFFYYATFTRENNARAHFTRVICSPGCPQLPPQTPVPAFCRALLEWEEEGEGEGVTVAPKACQLTRPTLTSLSELKRALFLTRPSCFAPAQTSLSKSASTPVLTLREYISIYHLSRESRTEHIHNDKWTCTYICRRKQKKYTR